MRARARGGGRSSVSTSHELRFFDETLNYVAKHDSIIGGGYVTPRVHSGLTYPTARARLRPPLGRAGGSLEVGGFAPASHEAVRLSGAVGEGPPNMTQRYTFTFTFTFICHPGKTHKDTSVIEMKVRYFCQVKSEQATSKPPSKWLVASKQAANKGFL